MTDATKAIPARKNEKCVTSTRSVRCSAERTDGSKGGYRVGLGPGPGFLKSREPIRQPPTVNHPRHREKKKMSEAPASLWKASHLSGSQAGKERQLQNQQQNCLAAFWTLRKIEVTQWSTPDFAYPVPPGLSYWPQPNPEDSRSLDPPT